MSNHETSDASNADQGEADDPQDIFDFITADTPEGNGFAEGLRQETAYVEIDGHVTEVDDGAE